MYTCMNMHICKECCWIKPSLLFDTLLCIKENICGFFSAKLPFFNRNCSYIAWKTRSQTHKNLLHVQGGSIGGRVVKLLTCGARGKGFDFRPRHLNFQRLVISCFQVAIWLKYRWSDVNPFKIQTTTNQHYKGIWKVLHIRTLYKWDSLHLVNLYQTFNALPLSSTHFESHIRIIAMTVYINIVFIHWKMAFMTSRRLSNRRPLCTSLKT